MIRSPYCLRKSMSSRSVQLRRVVNDYVPANNRERADPGAPIPLPKGRQVSREQAKV